MASPLQSCRGLKAVAIQHHINPQTEKWANLTHSFEIGEDKSRNLNNNTLLLYSGESGDTVQFAEYIQKNIQLYSIRHASDLSVSGVAHYTRREMADSLRTRVRVVFDERLFQYSYILIQYSNLAIF